MKPILFNTDMVRAILDGRKTQTRRLVKPKHRGAAGFNVCFSKATGEITGVYDFDEDERMYDDPTQAPYQPGDVLYVRETWDRYVDGNTGETVYIYRTYCRNRKILEDVGGYKIKWRPSIHMPKEAARLFLRVTAVRTERLQSISTDDIDAEGCKEYAYSSITGELLPSGPVWFKILWNKTIKPVDLPRFGWDANPWVWVIEFERIAKP